MVSLTVTSVPLPVNNHITLAFGAAISGITCQAVIFGAVNANGSQRTYGIILLTRQTIIDICADCACGRTSFTLEA